MLLPVEEQDPGKRMTDENVEEEADNAGEDNKNSQDKNSGTSQGGVRQIFQTRNRQKFMSS